MKVFHFITDLKRGGESTILLTLLPWLREQGVENTLCCLIDNSEKGNSVVGEFEKLGFPVHCLGVSGFGTLPKSLKLLSLLRNQPPDILHTYLFHANTIGRLASVFFPDMRVVSSVVSTDDWKKKQHRWIERITSHYCDIILVNSKKGEASLVERDKVASEKISLIYNGVDTTRLEGVADREVHRAKLGIGHTDFTVGFVGRLHPEKDPLILVRAFADAFAEIPNTRLLMLGEGKLRAEIEKTASELGIKDRLILAGDVAEGIAAYFSAMDVLAIPSEFEGIPAVLFEALYLKVPVVSFPLGGIPEVVSIESALLTPERSEKALAEALLKVATEPAMRKQLAEKGFEIVTQRFSNEAHFKNRLKLYESIMRVREPKFAMTEAYDTRGL